MKAQDPFDFDTDYGQIYDDIAQRVIPAYDQLFEMTQALLAGCLPPAANLLIVGCGTGSELATLAPAHPAWRFTCVDPSQAMIQRSAAVAARSGAAERVTFHHGYAADLAADLRFDAATALNVMHFLPDDGAKEDLVQQIAQRLKPGGVFLLLDLHGQPDTPSFAQLSEAWTRFMEIRGLTGEAKEAFMQRINKGITYIPEQRILQLCTNAGLQYQARWFTGLLYGGWMFTKT